MIQNTTKGHKNTCTKLSEKFIDSLLLELYFVMESTITNKKNPKAK